MKVMAVVIIALMIAFIAGSYLRQLANRRATGMNEVVAFYGEGGEITRHNLILAARELQILRMLGADRLLIGGQDMQSVLLGELLFSEPAASARLMNRLKRAIILAEYRISTKQLNDIYRGPGTAEAFWFLLKNEAQQTGVKISSQNAREYLSALIPQIHGGATYSEVMHRLVDEERIPEDEIFSAFTNLIAVLQFSRFICSSEDMTLQQLTHTVSRQEERIDVEFVRFDSKVFVDDQKEPDERRILEHFNRYKSYFAGDISGDNPYGFGYKLPGRVRLEYIALRVDDVSEIIPTPTQEQTQLFHDRHRGQFTERVPSDANDPNSPLMVREKKYAEVADAVLKTIIHSRTIATVTDILQQGRDLTEAETDGEAEQSVQRAGDYQTARQELSELYNVEVYAGSTGLLSADDLQGDEYMSRMYLEGYGHNPPQFLNLVRLSKLIFAMDPLRAAELGPFEAARPRMYENIGPLKEASGRVVMLAKVVEIQKAAEPNSVDVSYSLETLNLGQPRQQADEKIYSVRQKVIEDLKKLDALKTARSKAEEFVQQAAKYDWEEALDKFNKLYGRENGGKKDRSGVSEDVTAPAAELFSLQSFLALRKLSGRTMEMVRVQNEGDPAGSLLIRAIRQEQELVSELLSLIPEDANTVDNLPVIKQVSSQMSCYCIKDISVRRLTRPEYEQIKAEQAYQQGLAQGQSLAAVHFNPENILKRMNFKAAQTDDSDSSESDESRSM